MHIVKIGGGSKINVNAIIKDLNTLIGSVIIVHGANNSRDELLKNLGGTKEVITSLRGYDSVLSTDELLDAIMMSYSGLVNKKIVETCQQNNINAVGLTGVDGRLIIGRRNKGIKTLVNGKRKIIRDRSGKPIEINTGLINLLLENGYTPVITMPILDENYIAINSENDDLVALLNQEYNAQSIFFFVEEDGLLSNFDDKESRIKSLSKQDIQTMLETSEGRIKRKILAISRTLSNTKTRIYIADGRINSPIESAIKGNATIIQ